MKNALVIVFSIGLLFFGTNAYAQQDCFLGETKWFAGNFAPRGWAFAHGQSLPISQNTALFSILGTTYGGDGRTTFHLPDLRGRILIGSGRGPGLSDRRIGRKEGVETHTLTVNQLPNHTHNFTVEKGNSVSSDPDGKLLSKSGKFRPESTVKNHGTLHPHSVGHSGGNQPFRHMQPTLAINPIICLFGTYPSRN
jgi:microcystin-dependent protein